MNVGARPNILGFEDLSKLEIAEMRLSASVGGIRQRDMEGDLIIDPNRAP